MKRYIFELLYRVLVVLLFPLELVVIIFDNVKNLCKNIYEDLKRVFKRLYLDMRYGLYLREELHRRNMEAYFKDHEIEDESHGKS